MSVCVCVCVCVCTKEREKQETEENCINGSIKIHILHCILFEIK